MAHIAVAGFIGPHGNDDVLKAACKLSAVPAATAVPAAATEQHDEKNDNKNRGEIHERLLVEVLFVFAAERLVFFALRTMHSNSIQRSRPPFRSTYAPPQ